MSEFEYSDINDPTSGTPAQRQAAEEMAEAALEHWRDKAIAAHPGAAKLREYLTESSADRVMALAADLEAKLGPSQPEPTTPSVGACSPALPNSPTGGSDELSVATEALRRNPNSNQAQSDYLRAKHHQYGYAYIDE